MQLGLLSSLSYNLNNKDFSSNIGLFVVINSYKSGKESYLPLCRVIDSSKVSYLLQSMVIDSSKESYLPQSTAISGAKRAICLNQQSVSTANRFWAYHTKKIIK